MARWSYSAGEWGRNRVRAYEQARDGHLYLGWSEGSRPKSVALPTQDREAAKRKADELAARFRQPEAGRDDRLTLAELFDIYGRERTPLKGASKQGHDRRAAKYWLDIIGPARLVNSLTYRDAARYIAERRRRGDQRTGACHGRPVGARILDYDVRHLRAVLRWALGAGLIERHPLEGFRMEAERNPRRPLITAPQYDSILSLANEIQPTFRLALVLTHDTGHRIGAVSHLRWDDLDLEGRSVRWRAEYDKQGHEHTTPLTTAAVEALILARRRRGVISEWVLPSPTDTARPIARHLLRDWWQRGEKLAELAHVDRRGWHSLRRLFATELKHIPLKDLCELGGWKSPQTVLMCYQTADPVTMRAALEHRGRLERLGS